jgi:uncharacterized membrane protein
MPSPDRTSERIRAAALLLAAGLQIAESLVPRIPLFPWLRVGLSWAVLLPFAQAFGTLPTLGLFLSRNILSVAFGAQPPTTFVISSVSGILAILLLVPPVRPLLRRGWIGWVGTGTLLATAFNVAQLLLVTWVLVGHGGYLFQLGPILAWSVCSGALTGWLAQRWFPDLEAWDRLGFDTPVGDAATIPGRRWKVEAFGWLTIALVPAFIASAEWVCGLALGCLAFAAARHRADLRLLGSAWPFFAFLAWFHLLDTPGHVWIVPGVTREGAISFALHAGRLTIFLLAGRRTVRAIPWESVLGGGTWARTVGTILPILPRLFQASVSAGREAWRTRRDPGASSLPRLLLDRLSAPRGS